MRRLKCAEIWGGIKNSDIDVCSAGMTLSLHSAACDGGKGGDVYFLSVCSADRVTRIVLADVVGHGEAVSQVSEWVYDEMTARLDDPDLPGMLSDLNNRVATRGLGAMTTAAVLSYYFDLKQLYYCYAGHPPILLRRGTERWSELPLSSKSEGEANLPLGISDGVRYDMSDLPLAKGDSILVYSDGVVEAPNAHGELFGTPQLLAALDDAGDADPMEIKTQVLKRVRAWTGGGLDHDDVTLIAVRLD